MRIPIDVVKLGHNLARMWARLGTVVTATTSAARWRSLSSDHGEFVAALHEADGGSFNYRYPIEGVRALDH